MSDKPDGETRKPRKERPAPPPRPLRDPQPGKPGFSPKDKSVGRGRLRKGKAGK